MAKKALAQKMLTPTSLALALFAFFFCYFYSEAVLAYQTSGIGVTLSVMIYCAFTFFVFYIKSKQKNRRALIMYVPIFIIALGFSLHYNPMSHTVMTLTLLVLLGVQLLLFTVPNLKEAFSAQIIKQFLIRIIVRPLSFLFVPFKTLRFVKLIKNKSIKHVLAVLSGLLIAVPACGLLLWWFARADIGFADHYYNVVNFLKDLIQPKWLKIFLNLFYMFFIGLPLGAILIYNATEKTETDKAASHSKLSVVLVSTFLSAIATVIVLFVASQFAYFFFGATNGAVEVIGYSEYARRGFFELTYASAFIFAIVISAMVFCKKKADNTLPAYIKSLMAVICGSNIVILISAIKRMLLYIEVHGFSLKRLMTLWFMPVLGICTIMLLIKCLYNKFDAIKYIASTVVVAVCVLSVFNTDRFVAKQRLSRIKETETVQAIEIQYFRQLSYSCLPEVEEYLLSCDESLPREFYYDLCEYRNSTAQNMRQDKSLNNIFFFTLDRLKIDQKELFYV